MKSLVIVIALAACGQEGSSTFDAPPVDPPRCMGWPGPACGSAQVCGNGQIDTCWFQPMPGHCYYVPGQEVCDGQINVRSCADLGFYGGTTTCRPGCSGTDTSNCSACAPQTTACATFPAFQIEYGIAVSGTHVALAGYLGLAIFQGLTEIVRPPIPYVHSIASVPGGWLVAGNNPAYLVFVSTAGVVGTMQPISENAADAQLASGPTNRVIVVWRQPVGGVWHIFFAIADAAGAIVVADTDLFAVTGGSRVSVASDGTSFFVGSNGKLAKIATDGTRTITTGFPIAQGTTEDLANVRWSGTTGWYLTNFGSAVQRFDANGAHVGGVFATAPATEFVADGADLLALRDNTTTHRLELVRFDATGAITGTPREVGAGAGQYRAFARQGSVFVAWSREMALHASLVTAP